MWDIIKMLVTVSGDKPISKTVLIVVEIPTNAVSMPFNKPIPYLESELICWPPGLNKIGHMVSYKLRFFSNFKNPMNAPEREVSYMVFEAISWSTEGLYMYL